MTSPLVIPATAAGGSPAVGPRPASASATAEQERRRAWGRAQGAANREAIKRAIREGQ